MDNEIANLRRLLAVSSQLPWKHDEIHRGGEVVRNEIIAAIGVEVAYDINDPRDANLLVAAVNALPGLLDCIDALEKELERIRELYLGNANPLEMYLVARAALDGGEGE